MDEKAAWVSRVLGITVADEVQPQLSVEDVRQELLARIKEMITEAGLIPDKNVVRQLAALAGEATTAARGQDLMEAELAVGRLEEAVGRAKAEARMSEVLVREGMVNWRKAQLEWNAARTLARQNVAQLVAKVKSDPEVLEDPQADDAIAVAETFADLLPEFDNALELILDQLDGTADPEQRRPLIEQASGKLAAYRMMLGASTGLAMLQALADEEYGGVACYRELEQALDKLGKLLKA